MPELTQYVIGKRYLVPTVFIPFPRSESPPQWVPVLGPAHDDAKIIGFDDRHYHYDYRFLSRAQAAKLDHSTFGKFPATFAIVGVLAKNSTNDPNIVMRRLSCKRQYPNYPFNRPHWMKKLQDAYADQKLDERLICPHRGASLAGLTPSADGCVTCPLHGLRWDVETGRLKRWPGKGDPSP